MTRGKYAAKAKIRREAEEQAAEIDARDRMIEGLKKDVLSRDAEIARLRAIHAERIAGLNRQIVEGTSDRLELVVQNTKEWEERHAEVAAKNVEIVKVHGRIVDRLYTHFKSVHKLDHESTLAAITTLATGQNVRVAGDNLSKDFVGKIPESVRAAYLSIVSSH